MDKEKEAETEETTAMLEEFSFKELEKRNMALTKLYVKQVSTGIYGRVLLHLERVVQMSEEQKEEQKEDKS